MADEAIAVPAAQKGGWSTFLKDMAKIGVSGDLSTLTAPPFILSPTSLTEFPSYWAENFEAFAELSTPGLRSEERLLVVLEWFLGTFTGQFTAREQATGSEKKPLNPFLGEQFIGSWTDTKLYAEQVSHHPPVTAYYIENAKRGVTFEGHNAQRTSFSGRTINVKQTGHALLRVTVSPTESETYLVTFPRLQIEGIFFGKPYVELAESSTIISSTGLMATLDYSGKGYFSGKSHTFTANITQAPSSTPIYTITGQWTGTSTFTVVNAKSPSHKVGEVFAQFDKVPRTPITVSADQGEYESRRVWKDVADGIRSGDFNKASAAKTLIETSQRQKRKDELAAGKPFQTRLFKILPNDPEYHQLASMCKHKPENEESYKFIKPE